MKIYRSRRNLSFCPEGFVCVMPGNYLVACFLFPTSRLEQQGKLDPPAPLNAWYDTPFPFTERHVFLENIPVSTLQLAYQFAFRQFPTSQQSVWANLISKAGKQYLSKPKYYPNLTFYCIEYQ